MQEKLPEYSENIELIKTWETFNVELHPKGERIIIIWEKNELRYYDSYLKELDADEFFDISFPLKVALINSNINGGWIFDTIISNSICTITDFDEKSTLKNLFGILTYPIRRHSLLCLLKYLPEDIENIKICDSYETNELPEIRSSNFNIIVKSVGKYSFISEDIRILI